MKKLWKLVKFDEKSDFPPTYIITDFLLDSRLKLEQDNLSTVSLTRMITIKGSTKHSDILREALKFTWCEFVERTTIHGLRYILDKQGNKLTRSLWLIVTIVGFIASNVLVDSFWLRYKANPTRLKVDSFHQPLNMLDLPAITICHGNYIDEVRAREFIDELALPPNVSKTDLLKYLAQSSAFTSNIIYNSHEMNVLQTILDENNITISTTMEAIQTPCRDLLVRCRFEYQTRPCMELFVESSSYLGMCCTFNAKNNFLHTLNFGSRGGLSIMIQPTRNNVYSKSYSSGVKLLVHKSIDFPGDLSVVEMLSRKSENSVEIHSTLTKCSSAVQALPFDERDCILPTEKRLRVFEKYTEHNCNVECRVGQIIRLCGCLPYNYRVSSSSKYPVCNFTKISCLVSNYFEIHESRMHQQETCSCPPDCNTVSFDVQIAKLPLVTSSNFTVDQFYEGLNYSHLVARISFGKQVYRELRRDLLINIITLASGLGGIYSLFIGMGVLTFFEISYFLTIRLRANYIQIKKHRKILRVNARKMYARQLKLNNNYKESQKIGIGE